MSIQARMSQGDSRLYNVNRDVAHNFETAIQEVCRAIEERRYPPVHELARSAGVTDVMLGEACQAFCRFLAVQTDKPGETMPQCLERSGFFAVHPTARIIVMTYLGQVMLGYHWTGVHEATLGGVGPAASLKKLRWYGRKMGLLMRMPRWVRWWYQLRRRISKAYHAFSENTIYEA